MNAIIIKAVSGFYYAKEGQNVYECKARGVFRKNEITPLVGDFVAVEPMDLGKGVIKEIIDRKNSLERPPVANVDRLWIVVSTADPKPNMLVIDRLCAIAEDREIETVIAVNKTDLADPEEIIGIYKSAGMKTFSVCCENGEGIEQIKSELSSGINVFTGNSGVGKSSLLNLLIGENRAIVTDIAGTTRDILEEYITLHGISLKIIDTAGIRETKDIVEKIGVDRAREMAQKADLILYVVDSSVPLDENDEEIMEMLTGKKAIILYNKTDLQPEIQPEILKEKTGHPVIPISAKEEKGITELEEQIKDMFFGGEISFNDEVYITNARHKAALEEADRSLDLVRNSIEMGMPEDFFSIDLMNAYENLGKILGESVGEDLVNEIFSKFCMGK